MLDQNTRTAILKLRERGHGTRKIARALKISRKVVGKVIKMVVGESGNFPDVARIWHDTLITRGLGLISGMIAKAQARGEIRPGDPRQYAVGLISPMLVGVIFRETFEPIGAQPFDIPALMQQHAATVLRGMTPDTADGVAS